MTPVLMTSQASSLKLPGFLSILLSYQLLFVDYKLEKVVVSFSHLFLFLEAV